MGCKGAEHEDKGLHIAAAGAVGVEIVDQRHEGRNSGVELHGLDVLRHLLDGLVDGGLVGGRVVLAGVLHLAQIPYTVQEPLAPFTALADHAAAFSKSRMNMI